MDAQPGFSASVTAESPDTQWRGGWKVSYKVSRADTGLLLYQNQGFCVPQRWPALGGQAGYVRCWHISAGSHANGSAQCVTQRKQAVGSVVAVV